MIRNDQMLALDAEAREEFYRRAEAYLRETLAPSGREPDVRRLIRDSAARAAAYGIATEAGIVQFASLSLAAGILIDDLPDVRSYLEQGRQEAADARLADLAEFLAAPEAEFVEQVVSSGGPNDLLDQN